MEGLSEAFYLSIPVNELRHFLAHIKESNMSAHEKLNIVISEFLDKHFEITRIIFNNLDIGMLRLKLLAGALQETRGNPDHIAIYSHNDSICVSKFPDEMEGAIKHGEFDDSESEDDTDLGLDDPEEPDLFIRAMRDAKQKQNNHESELVRRYGLWLHIQVLTDFIEQSPINLLYNIAKALKCPRNEYRIEHFTKTGTETELQRLAQSYEHGYYTNNLSVI